MDMISRRLPSVVAVFGLSVALFGQAPPPASQTDEIGSAIAELGYKVVARPTPSSCWEKHEKERFGLKAKREWSVKSVKALPGASRTFYRFLIWEESYDDEKRAEARILQVRETPACAPVEQREFWMAVGFRVGNKAYILSTDAVLFEKEMSRWAALLEDRLHRPGAER